MKNVIVILLLCSANLILGQTAEEYYQKASIAYENADLKNTLKLLDKSIKLDSSNVECFTLKGQVQHELKQYRESFDTYSRGITLFPNDPYLYFNRGNLLLVLQEFGYAIKDFTIALKLTEDEVIKHRAITNRAAGKISIRDFEGAYQDLIISHKHDSTDLATLINLGAVCDEIGKGDETLKYLLKAIAIDSTSHDAYGNIGFKYQEMGEYKTAISYFDKVLELSPNDPLGYSNRGFNKLKLGDTKGAMSDIDKSIKIYPENSYAYKIRALIFLEQGKKDKACKDLQIAVDKGYTTMYGPEVEELQKVNCQIK